MYRSKLVVYDGSSGDVVCTLTKDIRIHDAVWTKCGHIFAACDESKLIVWTAEGSYVHSSCSVSQNQLCIRCVLPAISLLREVVTPHKFRVRNISVLSAEGGVVTSDPEGLVLVRTMPCVVLLRAWIDSGVVWAAVMVCARADVR
jgi:hypothetical protein